MVIAALTHAAFLESKLHAVTYWNYFLRGTDPEEIHGLSVKRAFVSFMHMRNSEFWSFLIIKLFDGAYGDDSVPQQEQWLMKNCYK